MGEGVCSRSIVPKTVSPHLTELIRKAGTHKRETLMFSHGDSDVRLHDPNYANVEIGYANAKVWSVPLRRSN